MLKGFLGIILFIIAVLILILLLIGGTLLKAVKNFRKAAEQAADKQAQRQRYETGRQRSQYSQRKQTASDRRQEEPQQEEPIYEEARRTQTATGETIIDQQHQERENKKIFDDSDGEYVDFEEA
jgi:predicted Holliday junction resolvase-like endonuclease